MDWRNRCGIAIAVMTLVCAGMVQSAQPASPGAATFADVEPPIPSPPQDPAPRPAAPAPAAPAPARPVQTAPIPTTPSATTPATTPAPATPSTPATGASALAIPPAPAATPAPAASNFIGANLFAEDNSAFALAGNRQPSGTIEFLGDNLGGTALAKLPPVPPSPPPVPHPNPPPAALSASNIYKHGAILAPSVRSFKIDEMQTPRPVDRVYFYTNYFNDVNAQINREYHSQVGAMQAYRNTFGFEKTFLNGQASFGMTMPINTLSVADRFTRNPGTTTSVGDVSLISKLALWSDDKTGSIFTGGFAITLPTGPSYFAGNRTVTNLHFTDLTPFVGYILAKDRFFFQGFNSISVPTSSQDVTYLYNDFGIGYYVYKDDTEDAILNALVPTYEVHVNTPLNHRGGYLRDPAATPDVVDFTYGLNAFIYQKTKMSIGVVTPVTGPRPFSYEILANISYRF